MRRVGARDSVEVVVVGRWAEEGKDGGAVDEGSEPKPNSALSQLMLATLNLDHPSSTWSEVYYDCIENKIIAVKYDSSTDQDSSQSDPSKLLYW